MHHELGDRVKFKLYQLYAFSTNSQLDEGGGVLDRQKKKKIPNLQLFPNLEGGGGGLERLGWFPKFNRLLVLMASLSQRIKNLINAA